MVQEENEVMLEKVSDPFIPPTKNKLMLVPVHAIMTDLLYSFVMQRKNVKQQRLGQGS